MAPRYKKRKDGRYYTSIGTGKYDPKTGREIRIPVYGRTQKELLDNMAKVRESIRTRTYVRDKDWTVGAYAEHWIATTKEGVVQESTMMRYNAILNNHLTSIEDIRLVDLTKSDVQYCLNQLSGHRPMQKEVRNMIHAMLEDAIDDGLAFRNVCRNVTIDPKSPPKTRALTDAERIAIPKCDFTLEEKAFVYILWYTGFRPEEVRYLSTSDIDLKRDTISVSQVLAFGKNQGIVKPPKTAAGIRTTDILDPLRPVLVEYLQTLPGKFLFTQKSGALHTKSTYRRFWGKIFDKINEQLGGHKEVITRTKGSYTVIEPAAIVTDITPYVFRHEYATILYYSGIDMKEAARLMGHSDTSMILDIYAELDKKKSSSKDKLSQYLRTAY